MLIYTFFTMRTIYLIIVIYTIVYFIAILWYDLVEYLYRQYTRNGDTD